MRELGAARSMLKQTEPLLLLKAKNPARYQQLELLVGKSYFDPKEVRSVCREAFLSQ